MSLVPCFLGVHHIFGRYEYSEGRVKNGYLLVTGETSDESE